MLSIGEKVLRAQIRLKPLPANAQLPTLRRIPPAPKLPNREPFMHTHKACHARKRNSQRGCADKLALGATSRLMFVQTEFRAFPQEVAEGYIRGIVKSLSLLLGN